MTNKQNGQFGSYTVFDGLGSDFRKTRTATLRRRRTRSRRPSELRAHALESHFRPNKSVDEKRDNASRRLVVKRRQTVVVYTAFFCAHTPLGRVRKQCTVVNLRGITFHRRRCARSSVPIRYHCCWRYVRCGIGVPRKNALLNRLYEVQCGNNSDYSIVKYTFSCMSTKYVVHFTVGVLVCCIRLTCRQNRGKRF